MVARSVLEFKGLLGFVFLLVFLLFIELKCSQDIWKSLLICPKQFCPSLLPCHTASNVTLHLHKRMQKLHWHFRFIGLPETTTCCYYAVEMWILTLDPAVLDKIRNWKRETY